MATGTLSGNSCSSYGAPATIVGTTAQTVASGHCYLLTLTGIDNVGNVATITTTVKVDTTAPSAPTGFAFSGFTNSYYPGAGSTVYYKGGSAGGFTATASGSSDADTGVAGYNYGAIAGTGWANASGAYTFTAASPSGTGAVTATNNAALTGSSASFTATADSTAPSGGAFNANGTAATGAGSSSYLNSGTTLTITGRTDFTDGGSGLASSTLTMATGTLSGNSCSAYGAPATITGMTSQTVASGNCYLLTLTGTDNVGNTAPTISTTVKVDTTAPTAPTGFSFSGLSNAYYSGVGSTVYYKGGSAGGFTATASGSSDADTGVAGYNYGAIAGTGWANASGAYTFTAASPSGTGAVTATNNAALTGSSASFTATADSTAPGSGAFTANGTAATGGGSSSYLNSGTTLTINSRTDYTDGGSGLANSTLTMATGTLSANSCSAYGAPATIVGTTAQTVASGHCYLLTLTGTDNVGNTATITTTVKVDTTAPSAPTGIAFSAPTNAYYPGSGSIVYFKGGVAGGFTATASGSTDADSGIAGYTYPALGVNWSNVAGAYTFSAAAGTQSGSVTAQNNAGLSGAGLTFTAQDDTNAPTGGAFTANGQAASFGGTSSYLTSGTTLTINSRTDFSETQSATESGLNNSTLTIQSSTLTGNSCGTYGSQTTITGTTSQTVASGNCYLLTLRGADNVGNNASAITTTVKVDTTAPSAPTGFTFSGLTNSYYPGAGTTVYYKGGSAGGFTATASGSSDADTGVASYTYGAIAGTGWSNASGAYTFTAASPSGSASVTATNGAGVAGSGASFTATADSTAPGSGAFSANGTAATGGGSSSYLNSGTTLTINSRTDYTDGGSGLASSTLTIQSASLTGNSCGGYGGTTTITGTTAQTVASGNCYLLTLTGTDNVGNTAAITTVVKVDTTAPSAPTGFTFSGLTNAYYPGAGTTIYYKGGSTGGFTALASGSTDADTGIASYTYGAIAGTGWSNASGAYTFTAASPSGTGAVTATNNAALTGSSASFTATADSTAPGSGALTANGQAATGGGSSSYLNSGTTLTINSRTDYTDGGSGLASSTLTMATGTLSANTCSAYGAPATIVGTTAQTVASGHCYLLTLTGTDNVGNTASITTTVMVDTTAPSAPTGFGFSALTNAYYPGAGTTVYFKGGAAGGFTATASGATDADTGVLSYSYGAVAGAGWSNVGSAYTFTGISPSGSGSVTATNNALLTGAGASFTATSDSTAPSGGAFSANGQTASGAGTSSYLNSGTTLTINSRTDYTDGGSGLASSTLTMATGTLSGNSCSAYGAPATIVGTTAQTVASGHCYLLTLTGTDNVGNVATINTTVMVDTTAPSAPTGFAFSGFTNSYYPGAGTTVYYKGGSAGGFTATASGATDADTGVAGYNYGAIAGSGWANASGAYTFTAASPSGTGAVTATNNAALTGSSASFTATADSTAPGSGAFTANGTAATGGGSSSYLNSGTTLTINSRTDYTDGGSGLANSTLTMATGTLSANSCSAYGAPATIVGTTAQTVASGHCYLLTLTGTDNVGNTATITTTVKVDTTAPSAPTGFGFSALTNAYYPGAGSIVFIQGGAAGGFTATASGSTDADSGVASYTYGAIAGSGWSNASGAYTFTAASPTGTGAVTATNNAGLTGSSASFTAQSDSTAPTGGALTANSVAASGAGTSSSITAGTTLTINSRTDYTEAPSGTASGLQSSTLTMATGTLSGNSCSAYGAPATIAGTTAQTVASGHCYLLTLTGTDNVGNAATVSTTVKVDTTAPSAPTGFSFSGLTNAYYPGAGTIVYFLGGSAGGFTALASGSTDADTGIASYNYGAVAGAGWSNVGGAYTFTGISPTGTGSATATNGVGVTGAATSFTAQSDSTAPAGGAFSANGQAASGAGTSSFITAGTTLTINSRTDYTDGGSGLASSTLTMATGTLSANSCSAYGAPATIVGTTAQTVASGHCYLLTLTGTDNVGNAATITTTVKVDTTAPSAPTGFSFGSFTNSYYPGSGTIVYFQGGSAGGFTATASGATDADTGIASYNYGAIAGSGWSNAAGAYTFTGASPTGSASVTATNGAGLTGSGASFTAQSDSTAPSGGAFTANSQAASGAGTTSFLNSGTTLTINSRTDYTETQSGTASGLANSTLTMQTGTLSANSCSAYGAPATIAGTTAQTVASGHCYLLTLTGTDNVGNAATITTTVKVDTTAPSAPTGFAFSGFTNSYYPGAGSIVFIKGGAAGGFTATASGSTDVDSGVASYTYGAIAGSGWSNASGAYTFTAASPTGTGAVTATNNAGLTGSSTSFTAQSDSTAPSGGAFTANGQAASGAGTSSNITAGTTLTINSRTDYTEAPSGTASGLANSTLTIQSATLTGNSCGAYGGTTTIAGTTAQTVASGNCYLLTLTGTDNVGNAATITTTVKVDTTAPSAPTGFSFSALTNAYYPGAGTTVYFKGGSAGGFTAVASGSTDADTGIASYNYGAVAGAGWSNVGGVYSFTGISPSGSGSVTATNGVGVAGSGTSFTATSDSTAPSGGAFSANGQAATGGGSSSYLNSGTTLTINSRTDYTDGGSGLASSTLTMATGTLAGNSCSAYGAPATIAGTTAQTVASGHCYLLTLTGTDNVGNVATINTTVMVDTTAPSAPTGFSFSGLTNAYYPGAGTTIYFKGGSAGGFTALASGSDRRRHGDHVLRLRRDRRQRLVERLGRVHLHRRLADRQRFRHRHQPGGPDRLRHELHRHFRLDRTGRRRLLGERPGSLRRRHVQLPQQRHHADDQQPHRLHRRRLRPRLLHADHPVGEPDRQHLRQLRRHDHDHRHHVTDRRQRQLLPAHPHRHRQRRQHRHDHHRRQGRHHRPVRAEPRLQRADERVLPGQRIDRLLQGGHRRRLHRHRQRQRRRRHWRRRLHLPRARSELVERRRRLHVQRRRRYPVGIRHRAEQRRTLELRHELHRPVRQHRSDRRRVHRQRHRGLGRRDVQLPQQRHDADDQQPHRLRRDAVRHRVRSRQLDAHHPVVRAHRRKLRNLRWHDDDHRHDEPDRRQRQLLPAHAARRGQRRQQRQRDHHHRQGRHDRPDRAHELHLRVAQRLRVLARRRLDRLLPGRHRRRLHGLRERLDRRRLRCRLVQLRRDRRRRLVERVRRVHLHRRLADRQRVGHRDEQRRSYRRGRQLHRAVRHDRAVGRRLLGQRPGRLRRRHLELSEQRHDADDQQPHRLRRDADGDRVGPGVVRADDQVRDALRQQLRKLRRADDDHGHDLADGGERQLLPAHAHRYRQRRQRLVRLNGRQGRHERSVGAVLARVLGADARVLPGKRLDDLLPGRRLRRLHRHRERLERR